MSITPQNMVIGGLLALGALAVFGSALAQSEDNPGGDTIIVTAQKRVQDVQDVPIR